MNGPAYSRRVRLGIIDSGLAPGELCSMPVVAARRFAEAGAAALGSLPVEDDALGHGTRIARIILECQPAIDLLIAQVFTESRKCSCAQVAAALDWLVNSGAEVVNLSFGIPRPDTLFRLACERAAAAGTILVSSAPARGASTFPAAYPFCIAVSGDARCKQEQISWLGTASIDFGADPCAFAGDPHSGGASFAAARISARIAGLLGSGAALPTLRATLQAECSYHGPERKRSSAAPSDSERLGPQP